VIEIFRIVGKITTTIRSTIKLSSGFERLVEVLIIFTVITKQPSLPIEKDLNIPEALLLAGRDIRQPGPIDLNFGAGVHPRLMTGELLKLGNNRPMAQGTKLGYVVISFLNKINLI